MVLTPDPAAGDGGCWTRFDLVWVLEYVSSSYSGFVFTSEAVRSNSSGNRVEQVTSHSFCYCWNGKRVAGYDDA